MSDAFERSKTMGVPIVKYYDEHVLTWWRNQPEHIETVKWLKSVYPGWK